MIHRILIPIVLGILLPYLWIDRSEGKKWGWRKRCLIWCPAVMMLGYSIYLALLQTLYQRIHYWWMFGLG